MEMLGIKQYMDTLLISGVIFDTFLTDRYSAIAKYMRENLAHIKHYFDQWHLKKSCVLLIFCTKISVLIGKKNIFEVFCMYIILIDFFNLEIPNVLTKISKEKECDNLAEWIKPCEKHLMWSATSTPPGDGELIWAKLEFF